MLVLTRKIGEEIIIDDAIRVRVLDVQGTRVKLGLIAPEQVCFKRGELPVAPRNRQQLIASSCALESG